MCGVCNAKNLQSLLILKPPVASAAAAPPDVYRAYYARYASYARLSIAPMGGRREEARQQSEPVSGS